LFTDKDECTRIAFLFSQQQDIVKSDRWLNLIPENGLDGGDFKPGHALGKIQTNEHQRKRLNQLLGKKRPGVGKKISETRLRKSKDGTLVTCKGIPKSNEHKANLSKPKKKIICPKCLKSIGGQANFNRWHGVNCKPRQRSIL